MASEKKLRLRRYHLGIKTRLTFFIIPLIIFLMLSAYFYIKAKNYYEVYQLSYTETSDLDYKVCYVPNAQFQECQPKDKAYISNLIDNINVSLKYNFNVSDLMIMKYKYDIKTVIVAHEKGSSKNIYGPEEEILMEEVAGEKETSLFMVNAPVKIEYRKYNEFINNLRREHMLLLESSLKLTLHIELEAQNKNIDEPIIKKRDITLKIPLAESTTDLTASYNSINEPTKVLKTSVINSRMLTLYYIICGVSLVFALILMLRIVLFLRKIGVNGSNYSRLLKKIMKEYNHIIVETKKLPNLEEFKIYELNSFDELLDVRETILKPIVWTKINSTKYWFMISNGEEMYRYILKEVDLNK